MIYVMHTHTHTRTHRAIKHLFEALKPYTKENGGPLKVEHVVYVEGRGNLIIEYTSEGAQGRRLLSRLYCLSVSHAQQDFLVGGGGEDNVCDIQICRNHTCWALAMWFYMMQKA